MNPEIKAALWNKEAMLVLIIAMVCFTGAAVFFAHHHHMEMRASYIQDLRANYYQLQTDYSGVSEMVKKIMERYDISEEDISPATNNPLQQFMEAHNDKD